MGSRATRWAITPDPDLARLEHEMRVQEKDFRVIDETYCPHRSIVNTWIAPT